MCTAISYWSTADHRYFGRTLDFPTKSSRWRLTFLPAGYHWRPLPAQAGYRSRFAILGGMRPIGDHYLAADGINAAGLVAAELYFPGQAVYQRVPQQGKRNLSPQDVIGWLLGRHQTVAEVARELDQVRIIGQQWYDLDVIHPFHWVLQDASGTYLIEPTAPRLKLRRLALGVVTNAPAPEISQNGNWDFLVGLGGGQAGRPEPVQKAAQLGQVLVAGRDGVAGAEVVVANEGWQLGQLAFN